MSFDVLITRSHAYIDVFDYDHYPICFEEFSSYAEPVFNVLDNSENIDTYAADLVESMTARYTGLSRKELKTERSLDRQVLSLFFIPLGFRLGGRAEALAMAVLEAWNKKYPREKYLPGTYEAIMRGFDANLLGLPLRKSKK